MRKFIVCIIAFASLNVFAGEGSTTDFIVTASFGYENGCSALDESDDKLRHTACALGDTLKKSGVSKIMFNKIINKAAETMPDYSSICK